MGLTLLAVQEAIARQPVPSSEALTERFVARQLLPPTIRPSSARTVLESDTAVLYVRYRVEPLALEVVLLGRTPADGAPIIGRIVTGSEEHSALFIARQIKGAVLPTPSYPQPKCSRSIGAPSRGANARLRRRNWSSFNTPSVPHNPNHENHPSVISSEKILAADAAFPHASV